MTSAPLDLTLPPRRPKLTIEEITALTRENGGDDAKLAANLRTHSHVEWFEDLGWAAGERRRLGLDDEQYAQLKALLRERNREIWGPNSWTPD